MKKIIPPSQISSSPKKKSKMTSSPSHKTVWDSKILLYLEGKDPNLLDKETYKIYRRISGTKAKILGPVPLPIQDTAKNIHPADSDRVHRRLFQILFPTENTISLLEKLALSDSIQASILVEETEPDSHLSKEPEG